MHITLGSAALRTLLLVVMRNATTDSPWPISNNPDAKYNTFDRDDSNLRIPLGNSCAPAPQRRHTSRRRKCGSERAASCSWTVV